MRTLLFGLACLLSMSLSRAQAQTPIVEVGGSVSSYIEEVFLGAAMSVSNITINGMSGDSVSAQVGSFQSNGSYLPLGSGIVMSSGEVVGVDWNSDTVIFGQATSFSVQNPFSGDPDLEALAGVLVQDVAIIEFDFVPAFGYMLYEYSFGSEEYPEWVNSTFNDAFGFFVSGPGLSGPYSSPAAFPDGSINAALIPNTDTGVSINTINNGEGDCFSGLNGPCMNCEYYLNNCAIADEALDGMTTELTVLVEVTPGETYHIKLAIGDAFDSAVLLKEGSFRSMAQPPVGLVEETVSAARLLQNPVAETLSLRELEEGIVGYSIIDLHGRDMVPLSSVNSSQLDLDVSEYESGLYFILLYDDHGGQSALRWMKQ